VTPKVIAGNWKMHAGPTKTRDFFAAFRPELHDGVRVLLFPPAVSLSAAVASPDRPASVELGVQNIHFEDQGAFTGETSAPMAKDAGATHALIGHSERRHVFGETDQDVTRKIQAALRSGLVPVICVGETLTQRKGGQVEEVILRQLDAALAGLGDAAPRFLIAYEPVWAIGTGETATPADAQTAHAALRQRLTEKLGADRAAEVPILYGGSVKPDNASDLLAEPDVDGLLVGGASLEPGSFAKIVAAAVR
jgi:triosephosphate isomerase (TIM)